MTSAGQHRDVSGSLRAVLFDVDGTLVDTNYLHAVTWWQAFAQGGHDGLASWRADARHP
jgi:beta-phosphoglucomutase-like phosphatase (HAD superfamily)